ncbi:mediator complex subunit Med5 [Pseudomassariella vexata]|uniref:Mediator of RNA polymerase II transcription subunit 5 n=1 Tax=Pseudomassariella vexata TaxID=1141098 RepID=A0A1Y2EJV1_9PEZI|nr:mediator complex subunit Med5 [Pseudomassariella vexata]ORY71831.1 mediator complex subunit Med5 [Pseudomassariella vexata]
MKATTSGTAAKEWSSFLALCIAKRLDFDNFASYVSILSSRHPVTPAVVADVFLKPHPANHESLDPRVPRYVQILTDQKLINTPSILKALYKYSTSHSHQANAVENAQQQQTENTVPWWKSSYGAEETIFYRLTKAVAMGTGIKSASDAIEVCKVMARWMTLFTTASAAFAQDVIGQLHSMQSKEDMEASRAAFVMLLLGIFENQVVLKALSRPFAKEARKAMSESLSNFVPSIMQSPGASQVASRLEFFRTDTLAAFEPVDKKKEAAKAEIDDLLDSTMGLDNFVIPELPVTNARAGLYIYLNALLVGRPLIDDAAFYSYLHNRYNGEIQTTAIDLILASFDVLANAFFRNEGQKSANLLRCYLINKLPLLLSTLATSMFPPLTPQYCITEALSQVDTNAFPTLSSMFDESNSNNTFTDSVRQDFCFACCLHGLIPEPAIEGLLGDMTYQTLPAGGRYVKETLVGQCMTDPERIQSLIGELDNMDGNVGAVCQAITEVIGRLCNNKETMSLKLLCSQLAKKPLSLDVMLLFEKPVSILHPLCELLDNWHYDEDQGEYQPVYEEFGSILLLVLAFVHRYSLTVADLGIRSSHSFIARLLQSGHLAKSLEDLSEQEQGHIGGWVHGLFDSESGGLSDELMSSCPPQDFYLLVSTLFYQTVLAFSTDRLSEEGLNSGVEYLVDTFLLPSLVMAITYLSNHLRIDNQKEQKAVIKILQLILLTKQGSNEAQTMLSGVLNIVAKPLEHALRTYQRQDPKSQDIEPLLKAIKDNIRVSRRTGGAEHNELEQWTGQQSGGLVASVRHTLQGFVQWSLHPSINIMPTSYSHRQILAAIKLLGPKRLLRLILEEVRQQTDAGSGSVAYDVATALICAPDVTNVTPPPPPTLLSDPNQHPSPVQSRVTLRTALRWEVEDFKKIQKSDPAMAETVVRLYRRVEAQLLMPQPAEMLQNDLGLGLDQGAAASLGEALAAAQGDGLVTDDTNVNLDLGDGTADIKFDMGSGNSTGGLDLGTDDDIFGVGNGADLLEGWDGMDLS